MRTINSRVKPRPKITTDDVVWQLKITLVHSIVMSGVVLRGWSMDIEDMPLCCTPPDPSPAVLASLRSIISLVFHSASSLLLALPSTVFVILLLPLRGISTGMLCHLDGFHCCSTFALFMTTFFCSIGVCDLNVILITWVFTQAPCFRRRQQS